MADLIGKASEVHELIRLVAERNQQLAPKPREVIEQAGTRMAEVLKLLKQIHENVFLLDDVGDDDKELIRNVEYWNQLPPGPVEAEALRELYLHHSETLLILHRGAVDINQVTKFSPEEVELARTIGNNFVRFGDPWNSLKIALTKANGYVKSRFGELRNASEFMRKLKEHGIISEYTLQIAEFERRGVDSRINKWTDLDVDDFGRPKLRRHENHPCRLIFRDFDTSRRQFITGDWFNAYAYSVFEDQLKRLDSNYEIYSLVKYSTAGDVGEVSGDFDLIVNVDDRLLLVECKSGAMDGLDRRDEFEAVKEKTRLLRNVFTNTHISQYGFLLVYNPSATDPALVEERLQGSEIKALPPHQIRGAVIDLLRAS